MSSSFEPRRVWLEELLALPYLWLAARLGRRVEFVKEQVVQSE